jgi:hypothetical protein
MFVGARSSECMTVRLVLIATMAVTALLVRPVGAGASCVEQSSAEQQARAQVIVDGLIVAAPRPGRSRLHVSRYLKGSGPPELIIVGGSSAGAVSSIDIDPAAGERWRILGRPSETGTVVTTVCDGSARVDDFEPSGPADRAPAAPVARTESGDGAPAWLPGLSMAVGTAGLVGAWLRGHGHRRYAPSTAAVSSSVARTNGTQ